MSLLKLAVFFFIATSLVPATEIPSTSRQDWPDVKVKIEQCPVTHPASHIDPDDQETDLPYTKVEDPFFANIDVSMYFHPNSLRSIDEDWAAFKRWYDKKYADKEEDERAKKNFIIARDAVWEEHGKDHRLAVLFEEDDLEVKGCYIDDSNTSDWLK